MEHNESPKVVIQIRGRIHKGSPTFDACNQARERKTFQRMLELSDEAVTTRTRLNQMLHDHPLHSKLKDMTTCEAIGYLLVMAEQVTRWDMHRLSDKGFPATSDIKNEDERSRKERPSKTTILESAITAVASSGATALELDDEVFDAFSSFTSNMQ